MCLSLVACSDSTQNNDSTGNNDKINGIDLSHYQGKVDWKKLNDSAVAFVFIKATEGHHTVDKSFNNHWKGSSHTKLLRGVYHFFDPAVDAKSQALHFLATTAADFGDFPPVVDIESRQQQASTEILAALTVFLSVIEQKTSRKPMIYTSPGFWDSLDSKKFSDHHLWLADYSKKAKLPKQWHEWLFWQFSSGGIVDGVEGNVDMSVFSKGRNALEQLKCTPL